MSLAIPALAVDFESESTISISRDESRVRIDYGITGGEFNVDYIKDTNSETAEFNKLAKELGIKGKISNCDTLIDIPVGVRDGNHTYGAYCKLDVGKTKILIITCHDQGRATDLGKIGNRKGWLCYPDFPHARNLRIDCFGCIR